jgi:hypothetical protein
VRKVICFALYGLFVIFSTHAGGQPVAGGVCRPVSERTQDVGCWILSNDSVGELTGTQTPGNMRANGLRSLLVYCSGLPAHGGFQCRWLPRGGAGAGVRAAHGLNIYR